jgi:hypothetical protein
MRPAGKYQFFFAVSPALDILSQKAPSEETPDKKLTAARGIFSPELPIFSSDVRPSVHFSGKSGHFFAVIL